MTLTRKTIVAAAACSWIDPATELLEIDTPLLAASVQRSFLTGNHGYRFCNYLDVWLEWDVSKRSVVKRGIAPASGIYFGPSYAGIPSHIFKTIQEVFDEKDAVRFTQVTGARTVSPEVIGEKLDWLVGEVVTHQVLGLPPIWSKLQIRIFKDGRPETQLLQHSWFSSLTLYSQKINAMGMPEESFVRINHPSGQTYYSATKDVHYPTWDKWGWGPLAQSSTPGPTRGNPWGIRKGLTGGSDSRPRG